MITITHSIITGIVQGLSEFLPISSSAHIVFATSIYKILTGANFSVINAEETFFDIMLHLGTLIAVLVYFRKMILDIIVEFFKAVKNRNFSDEYAKLGLYILIGTMFTVIIAYPLKDVCEKLVYSPQIVSVLLIGTGIILFLSEYVSKNFQAKTDKMNLKKSIIMGLAQGLAVFPGFSRSGLTIASGLFSGLDRLTATKFSFLLTIPIILGTSILYPILEINTAELTQFNWINISIGTGVSAVVGYLCIKYFLIFVSKFSLKIFAYYCLIAGIVLTVFFNFAA
ncbi:undecaprenyl-diphosphate phosphatase [bacterium]|nr:undecaprenyl-diphosphate phosphatase [bacterium]